MSVTIIDAHGRCFLHFILGMEQECELVAVRP